MKAKSPRKQPLSVVILAAGQGKRMRSDLPKVLQPLAGHPLLAHVLDAANALGPELIHIVYGHGGERVRTAVRAPALRWVLQGEQLGTGHALQQAMPGIPDDHLVLVLYGDVPLIRTETLRALLALAGPRSMGLLTVTLPDATGYGRVVRGARGQVLRVVEQQDATAQQRRIREANTGVLAVAGAFAQALAGAAAQRQRAARVLPHRRHRAGGQGQIQGGAAAARPPSPKCWA